MNREWDVKVNELFGLIKSNHLKTLCAVIGASRPFCSDAVDRLSETTRTSGPRIFQCFESFHGKSVSRKLDISC